jgi:hypothetical protein
MIKPIGYRGYKLNPNKLQQAPQSILLYVVGAFYYTEDYEYFDIIKPYLDIPEEPKSIEELSQELDEKFEKLLVKTKRNFYTSKESAKYRYNQKFKKIDDDFDYMKEWGHLPSITLVLGGEILMNNSNYVVASSSSLEWKSVYNIGNGDAGYYTNGSDLRIYMPKKPNFIVGFCMRNLLGFKWMSGK